MSKRICIKGRWFRTTPDSEMPKLIRVSLGTAMLLGLSTGKMNCLPTTAYLMTYTRNKCIANCAFCPQARKSRSKTDSLSRVTWPIFDTTETIERLFNVIEEGKAKRVCIQALNYPDMIQDVTALTKKIRECRNARVSVSCRPKNKANIIRLKESGVDRIGIPLDASTRDLFNRVKGRAAGGPYTWGKQLRLLQDATAVFGKGNVSTHLIVGLGETERDLVRTIQMCYDLGVLPGLFAFTPIPGTALENCQPPSLEAYRRIQLARHLILKGGTAFKDFIFDQDGRIACFGVQSKELAKTIRDGQAFRTSGCPDCNRPYYNEKPSGPIYNYPRALTDEEVASIEGQFKSKVS